MKIKLLTGFNYVVNGEEVRHEAGEVVDDFPSDDVTEWLAAGAIAYHEEEPAPRAMPRSVPRIAPAFSE